MRPRGGGPGTAVFIAERGVAGLPCEPGSTVLAPSRAGSLRVRDCAVRTKTPGVCLESKTVLLLPAGPEVPSEPPRAVGLPGGCLG